MAIAQVQRQSFEDRLKRINSGGPNTMGEVHIGPRDEENARKGKANNTVRMKKSKRKPVKVGQGSSAILVPLAVFIGAFCAFVGQAAAYHFFGEGGLMPITLPVPALEPYLVFAPLVFAGVLAMMFSWTFGFTGLVRKLALIGGIAAMIYAQPQMIERFPGIYANFFSPAYVAETLGRTV